MQGVVESLDLSEETLEKGQEVLSQAMERDLEHGLDSLGAASLSLTLQQHNGSYRLDDVVDAWRATAPDDHESTVDRESTAQALRALTEEFDIPGAADVPEEGSEPLDGLTFVFTGTLTDYTRSEVKELVQGYGARTTSSVSSKTDYLVVAADPGTSKRAAADEHGIQTMDEAEFLTFLGENVPTFDSPQPQGLAAGATERVEIDATLEHLVRMAAQDEETPHDTVETLVDATVRETVASYVDRDEVDVQSTATDPDVTAGVELDTALLEMVDVIVEYSPGCDGRRSVVERALRAHLREVGIGGEAYTVEVPAHLSAVIDELADQSVESFVLDAVQSAVETPSRQPSD